MGENNRASQRPTLRLRKNPFKEKFYGVVHWLYTITEEVKAPRPLAANEIACYGSELSTVTQSLKDRGQLVGSVERMKGSNAGWIVRWFKSEVRHPAEQASLFP